MLAIVMDVFTDTEILCDLLEAANKRMVFVYLLLDHGNLNLFSEMCDKLQIAEDLFKVPRLSASSHVRHFGLEARLHWGHSTL